MCMADESKNILRPTTIVRAPRLSERLGVDVTIASEAFQYTGSFKFRAAYNLVSKVPQKLIITASSGNFGQALAYACRLVGKSCIIVMPSTSAAVKVNAVSEFGGQVEFVDVLMKSRAERVAELATEHPEAYIASAYDDPLVIEGNSSLGKELTDLPQRFDAIVVPIGGGGLISGILTGIQKSGKNIEVYGAEPLLGNDAARSLREGKLVRNESEPATIADGARPISLGKHNWAIIQKLLHTIIEIPEQEIGEAVRLLYGLANLKVEPTGALSVAALLTEPARFRGRSICCIASGGNVDPAVYTHILAG